MKCPVCAAHGMAMVLCAEFPVYMCPVAGCPRAVAVNACAPTDGPETPESARPRRSRRPQFGARIANDPISGRGGPIDRDEERHARLLRGAEVGPVFCIALPLPPRGCSSNGGHTNWRKTAAVKSHIGDCMRAIASRQAAGLLPSRFIPPVELLWQYCLPRTRVEGYAPRDCSNGLAALKAAEDAVVRSGLLPGDDDRYVVKVSATIARKNGAEPCVLLSVLEVHAQPIDDVVRLACAEHRRVMRAEMPQSVALADADDDARWEL